ncbi:MAG: YggS family pyridoxal phosphate enzyme [Acidimicrobiales bacterium]
MTPDGGSSPVGDPGRAAPGHGKAVRAQLAPPPIEVIAERLSALRRRIESTGRDPEDVRIVAVTKGFDASAPGAAFAAGLQDVGENYADELLAKASSPQAPDVKWHMLGAIQRRRIKSLATVVGCWQTLSRSDEVESLARHAPGTQVFVQVETTGLPNRNGCDPSGTPELVATARRAGLTVRGLMTVGPQDDLSGARKGFELVASLAAEVGLEELSMGMSDDLDIALRAGATMLRVGRGLFGPRA